VILHTKRAFPGGTMTKLFLINDALLFDPSRRSLFLVTDYPQRAVVLHGPSSECLARLLEQNNQIVSQKYLFAEIWEKQGAVVSTNTLYQNIASVRKALKSAGLSEDIIITLPKVGFKCVASVREGQISDFIPAEEKTNKPPEAVASSEVPQDEQDNKKGVLAWVIIFGTAGVLFFLSCAALYLKVTEQESVYKDYSDIGEVNGCRLFSSYSGEDKSISTFKELGERYALDCKNNKMAYLTINRLQQGQSLLICNHPLQNKSAHCKSYLFREEYHEK
jgi:DNA-binding winged helix-turn-helix (wHTH) protein